MSESKYDIEHREVAYYEAGRAVTGIVLGIQVERIWVTPIPSGERSFFVHEIGISPPLSTNQRRYLHFCENLIQMFYAGSIAENKSTERYCWRRRSAEDIQTANKLFHALSKPPSLTRYESADEIWLHACLLVDDVWPQIERAAQDLYERRVLHRYEIIGIMGDVR